MPHSAISADCDDDIKKLMLATFQRFDQNGDGIITRSELVNVLTALRPSPESLDEKDVDQLMDAVDQNKDGKIQYSEFVHWVMKEVEVGEHSMSVPVHASCCPMERRLSSTACNTGRKRAGSSIDLDYRVLLPERFDIDIAKRYDLDKLTLGEGGYGKVFVAKDKEMKNRRVAVKRVTRTASNKQEFVDAQIQKEIEVMKELDHPNICKLFATFAVGPHMFFIMELCEGGEVFDRIIENGCINERSTAEIIGQVAAALAYAHGRKIAHRDIKPENVVFCTKDPGDNRIKVIDWGLAMTFVGSPMQSAVGSFTYAAPEVITSRNIESYTQTCDLWSLGVLTYVMLCGQPPFWGTERDHLKRARREKYPMDSATWKSMNPDAIEFVRSLLKARPSDRLPVDQVVAHKWLQSAKTSPSIDGDAKEVLHNLKRFAHSTTFSRMCITAVARQLDHKHLKHIHSVFREMDTNGDGVLSFDEVQEGFKNMFGASSSAYLEARETFDSLDLDGSKFIDYTEFCAAALGQKTSTQEDVIWAAFKTFDRENNGSVTKSDICRLLKGADVQAAWSQDVCDQVGQEIVQMYDKDGDGSINFNDWKAMMEQCWDHHAPQDDGPSKLDRHRASFGNLNAYQLLSEVSKLPQKDLELSTEEIPLTGSVE